MLVALCAGEDHPQEIVGELSWLMFLQLFSRMLKSKMVLSDHKSMLEFLELLLFIAKFPIEVIPLGMFGTPLIKGPAQDFTHNIVSASIFQVSQIIKCIENHTC